MRLIHAGDRTAQQRNGQEHSTNHNDRQQTEADRLLPLPVGFRYRCRSNGHFVFFAAFLEAFFGAAFGAAFGADFGADFFAAFLEATAASFFAVAFVALLPAVAVFLSPNARSQFFQNSGVVPVRTIGPLIDSAL